MSGLGLRDAGCLFSSRFTATSGRKLILWGSGFRVSAPADRRPYTAHEYVDPMRSQSLSASRD